MAAIAQGVCTPSARTRRDILHSIVEEHLPSFLSQMRQQQRELPAFVERELTAYLACGQMEHGAVCYFCDGCGHRLWVALTCKRRGFCPSCCGRRMCDIAAHWVEQVLPDVPMRQWVLSIPVFLRYVLLRHRELIAPVLAIYLRVLSAYLRKSTLGKDAPKGRCGAITVEQRFGDGGRLNLHFHSILPDGVFVKDGANDTPRFVRALAPTREDLAGMAVKIRKRVMRLLRRRGLSSEEDVEIVLGQEEPLGQLQAASLTGRIAVGSRAGGRVTRVMGETVVVGRPGGGLYADADGFNLHAGVHLEAGRRKELEALCRYLLRPPFARERLSRLPNGDVMVRLKRPYQDGTKALVFSPLNFVARLCALVPPPRVHLVHHHGVFAPHSSWREQVRMQEPEIQAEPTTSCKAEAGPKKEERRNRLSWAERLLRSFGHDVLKCACGGRLRFLCVVFAPQALLAIMASLGIVPASESGKRSRAGP